MKTNDLDKETYSIIGAAMEVQSQLGHGFLEPVYQEALAMEFCRQKIPFEREQSFTIYYKGEQLQASYKPDFVCFGNTIVELKALQRLTGVEEAQVINYLKACDIKRGLLLNFGAPRLEYKRLVFSSQLR